MARRFCQFLFSLACLYAAAVGLFAWFGYDGARPSVLDIAGDFHGWVRAKVRATPAAAPLPGTLPPATFPANPAPTFVEAPPPPPPPPPANDPRSKALVQVREVLLPKAMSIIASMDGAGTKVAELKVDARVVLVEARDLLGGLIDENPTDKEVHREYKRVADLLIAVDKR